MAAETEHERWRDEFEWDQALEHARACPRCGGEIETWTEDGPCCSGYDCSQTIYCYACPACRVMTDGW